MKKLYEVSAYADECSVAQIELDASQLEAVVQLLTKLEANQGGYGPSFSMMEINGRGEVVETVVAL